MEPADIAPEQPGPVGPTCRYKGERSKVFEGDDVARAEQDGWVDNPTTAKENAAQAAFGENAAMLKAKKKTSK